MNAWQIISTILLGFSLGLFVGAKYIHQTAAIKYSFDKVKVNGDGNSLKYNMEPLPADEKKPKKILKRIFKRNENKQKRLSKKS